MGNYTPLKFWDSRLSPIWWNSSEPKFPVEIPGLVTSTGNSLPSAHSRAARPASDVNPIKTAVQSTAWESGSPKRDSDKSKHRWGRRWGKFLTKNAVFPLYWSHFYGVRGCRHQQVNSIQQSMDLHQKTPGSKYQGTNLQPPGTSYLAHFFNFSVQNLCSFISGDKLIHLQRSWEFAGTVFYFILVRGLKGNLWWLMKSWECNHLWKQSEQHLKFTPFHLKCQEKMQRQ